MDYDSPWKEALDVYFRDFLALFFPAIHDRIDWSRVPVMLDKEFQQLVPDAEVGRRTVDKLVKVWMLDGIECWLLIHIEVQATRDDDFAERMYVYNHRIFDLYQKAPVSLAVLADDEPSWHPREYRVEQFGCVVSLKFPTVKVLDYAQREEELEKSDNPFAWVVLAHLKGQATRDDMSVRLTWKLHLVRALYRRGLSIGEIRQLLRFMDWLMQVPEPMRDAFWQEVVRMKQEKEPSMPFVSSLDEFLVCRALRDGIKNILGDRFGDAGTQLMPEIQAVYEEEQLHNILRTAARAASLDEIRSVLPTAAP